MGTILVRRKTWGQCGALSAETATFWLQQVHVWVYYLNCYFTTEAAVSHCLWNSPGLPLHLWLSSRALALPSVHLLSQLYHEPQSASTQQNIRMAEPTTGKHNPLSQLLTATRFLRKEAGHRFCPGILPYMFIWLVTNPELPKFICLRILRVGRFGLNTAL